MPAIIVGCRAVKAAISKPASLRTSGVEIYGAARGLSPEVMAEVYGQIVQWAQAGTLTFTVRLSEIEAAWQRPSPQGRRLVVVP
jgi:NADPH2:quinone reductase